MSESDQNTSQIIKIPEGGLTIWQPNKALPVLGAATVIWAGRGILRYILRQRLSRFHTLEQTSQQSKSKQTQRQKTGGYTVVHHYQVRWTISVQPDDER